MNILISGLYAIAGITLFWGLVGLIRKNKISKFIKELLTEERSWVDTKIKGGSPFVGYKRALTLNYGKMLYQFWKPLRSHIKPKLEDYYRNVSGYNNTLSE